MQLKKTPLNCSQSPLGLLALGTRHQGSQKTLSMYSFDPFLATASDLQVQLGSRKVNSSHIVKVYLDEIAKNNEYLRAVIVTAPDVLATAAQLDHEREKGQIRGPLHGIPILVKVGR